MGQAGLSGYDSNGWWQCSQCGTLVPNGCTHSCPTGAIPPPTNFNVQPTTQERIAAALERIAAALEKEA